MKIFPQISLISVRQVLLSRNSLQLLPLNLGFSRNKQFFTQVGWYDERDCPLKSRTIDRRYFFWALCPSFPRSKVRYASGGLMLSADLFRQNHPQRAIISAFYNYLWMSFANMSPCGKSHSQRRQVRGPPGLCTGSIYGEQRRVQEKGEWATLRREGFKKKVDELHWEEERKILVETLQIVTEGFSKFKEHLSSSVKGMKTDVARVR